VSHDLAPGEAVLVDWTEDRYHSDTEFASRSQLDDLSERGPATYHAKHVARTMVTGTTAAMLLGTHTHLAVLEPDRWNARLAPPKPERPPGAYGRGKKGSPEKDAYTAWKVAEQIWESCITPDAIVLEQADLNRVVQIAAAVRRHPYASMLLGLDGAAEKTVLWHHEATGLRMRARLDWLAPIDETTVVVADLKTTVDPSLLRFGTSIARYGYHRQGAIYADAVQALYPEAEVHYVLIAVRSSAPFEVGCYTLGPDELAVGRHQYEKTMADLVRRRTENDWLADWQRGCSGITMPGWAYRTEE